ncbi:hypothetical protein B0H11DRAFT_1906006 [Mycena galericulata]|nr:hypothetical protein B0H11DRAFT_1906006 [Mycena galericulata]
MMRIDTQYIPAARRLPVRIVPIPDITTRFRLSCPHIKAMRILQYYRQTAPASTAADANAGADPHAPPMRMRMPDWDVDTHASCARASPHVLNHWPPASRLPPLAPAPTLTLALRVARRGPALTPAPASTPAPAHVPRAMRRAQFLALARPPTLQESGFPPPPLRSLIHASNYHENLFRGENPKDSDPYAAGAAALEQAQRPSSAFGGTSPSGNDADVHDLNRFTREAEGGFVFDPAAPPPGTGIRQRRVGPLAQTPTHGEPGIDIHSHSAPRRDPANAAAFALHAKIPFLIQSAESAAAAAVDGQLLCLTISQAANGVISHKMALNE